MRGVCRDCPFRKDSDLIYDLDGADALEKGHEPRCHDIVGLDQVFAEHALPANRCRGFELWEDGHPDFRKPEAA